MYQQPIILFDGVCNLCNSAVNFVIKRDKKSTIKFAVLQSSIAQKLVKDQPIKDNDLSSFVFVEKGKILTRSTAAFHVCRYLTGIWPLMYGFIIIPKLIRDGIYNWVAKNRYHWFGKKDKCMVPTPEIKARFLDE